MQHPFLHIELYVLTGIIYWLGWILRAVALFIVPPRRKPSSSMAWLLVIFLSPILGWLVFLLLGTNKLPKSRRDLQKTLDQTLDARLKSIRRQYEGISSVIDAPVPSKYNSLSQLAKSLGHLPVFSRNHISPFVHYDDVVSQIIKDIDHASYTLYIEYYILTFDSLTAPLFDSLKRAKDRGVSIRVLYDAYGSHKYPGFKKMKQRLADDEIPAYPLLPFRLPTKGYVRPDLRNHRKLVVVDNKIGYTGSQNLIARDYHRKDSIVYDELVVRLEGPIAGQLSAVFSADWYSEVGVPIEDQEAAISHRIIDEPEGALLQLLPSGPGYDDENNLKLFTHSIHIAQSSITIVNPYFVPTEPLMSSIISAAKRGVRIRMINSAAIDQWFVAHAQRSYYFELLSAGVEIYFYKKPTLLHSKFMIIDNEMTFVGSSNMDVRSFELNHELTLISYSESFSGKMNQLTNDYIEKSKRLSLSKWRRRKWYLVFLDNLARLTSSLQ